MTSDSLETCPFCGSGTGDFMIGYNCMTFFSMKEDEEDFIFKRSEECIEIERDNLKSLYNS